MFNNVKHLFIFLIFVLFLISLNSTQVQAAENSTFIEPVLGVNIPTVSFSKIVEDGTLIQVNWLAEYVTGVYKYLLGFSATVAVFLIMVGGLQYVVSPGGSELSSAKKRITNGVTGLILLFSVYLILFIINPNLTKFDALEIEIIQEIPYESAVVTFSGGDAVSGGSGNYFGASKSQDCYLKNYGDSKSAVESNLVSVSYKTRSYRVNKLIADDFKKALAAIDASGLSYDITTSTAGGTYNWRANKNSPSYLSPHAFGIAIDVNPDKNPNCPKACTTGGVCNCIGGSNCETLCRASNYDIPQAVIQAFTSNGFTWGGNWSRVKDYMHFHYTKNCGV